MDHRNQVAGSTLGYAGTATECDVRQTALTEIASRLRDILGYASEIDISIDDFHSRLSGPRPQEVQNSKDGVGPSGALYEINGLLDQIDNRMRSALSSTSRLRDIA